MSTEKMSAWGPKTYPYGHLPKNLPACGTVGELIDVLKGLPRDLPISPMDEGVKPVCCNIAFPSAHISLEENDGTFD